MSPRRIRASLILGLTCAATLAPGCSRERPSRADSIVVISLDTLAAGHLRLYGYERDTLPSLDRFAQEAVVFERAHSTAPKTLESHMSMFTSLYPSVHGMLTTGEDEPMPVLPASVRTLPEILKEHGYYNVGFHAGGFVEGTFGFDRGFDLYRSGRFKDAARFLADYDEEAPFFLFAHTYRVHDPYTPKPPDDRRYADPNYEGEIVHSKDELKRLAGEQDWAAQYRAFWDRVDRSDPADVAHLVDLYDALIHEVDEMLAALFKAIDRYAPDATVIVLSDHGEEFGQHGDFTHEQLYQEILHVPLIVRLAERRAATVTGPVSLIDLTPTILDLLDLSAEEPFQGQSLVPWLRQSSTDGFRSVFSERKELRMVLRDGMKLIDRDGKRELFDLAQDPEEEHDLWASSEPKYSAAREELGHLMDSITAHNNSLRARLGERRETKELADTTLDELRKLGYIAD